MHNGAEEVAIWGEITGSLALGVKFCCHMITEMNYFWERESCKQRVRINDANSGAPGRHLVPI